MKSFSKLNLSGSHPSYLIWKQPKFAVDYYELSDDPAGETLYATLAWPKWLSDLAVARSAVGIWHFDRLGWTRSTIVATLPAESTVSSSQESRPAESRIASFEIGWFWEGDLILSSGNIFHWYRTKTFRNAWALTMVISAVASEPVSAASRPAAVDTKDKPVRAGWKLKLFPPRRPPKPTRQERLVYEIEFGIRWFKAEAWITLPTARRANDAELIFLLCAGMYLGHCYNQDSAGAVAVSSTAAVS